MRTYKPLKFTDDAWAVSQPSWPPPVVFSNGKAYAVIAPDDKTVVLVPFEIEQEE